MVDLLTLQRENNNRKYFSMGVDEKNETSHHQKQKKGGTFPVR